MNFTGIETKKDLGSHMTFSDIIEIIRIEINIIEYNSI